MHRLMRILSRKRTTSLYRLAAQMAPDLNVQLRKKGLSTYFLSDFQFESLHGVASGHSMCAQTVFGLRTSCQCWARKGRVSEMIRARET